MNITSQRPVPLWLKTLAFRYIGPCIGFYRSSDEPADSPTPELEVRIAAPYEFRSVVRGSSCVQKAITQSLRFSDKMAATGHCYRARAKTAFIERFDKMKDAVSPYKTLEHNQTPTRVRKLSLPSGMSKTAYKRTANGMRDLVQRSGNEIEDVLALEFWRCVAKTLDRLCWVVLGSFFCFITMCFLMKGYGHVARVEREWASYSDTP